jgi:mannosyltransferase
MSFNYIKDKNINHYVMLAAITLLAAMLRFYKLGEWSFWIDEIFTINRALAQYSNFETIVHYLPPNSYWVPSSFILTAQALNMFGISEWSARLVPTVIGVITIPILYFPLRSIFGKQIALISLVLLALSTWHIEWSQNARFYSSLMLFQILALILFFYGIERDRPLYIFFYMLFMYLAISERLFAVFLIPIVLLYLLFLKILPCERPPGYRPRNILLTLLLPISGAFIVMFNFIRGGSLLFSDVLDWFLLYPIDDPLRLLSFISFEISIPLMSFAFFSGIYLILKRNRAGLLFFLSAIVPVILLLALNPFLFTKSRYIFATLPSWIILCSVGIKEIVGQIKGQAKLLALGFFVIFIATSTGSNLLYYQVNHGNRLDWRTAFSLVEERRQPSDEVVTWWPQWEGFYWDREIIFWGDLSPDSVVNSGKRFWFILDNEIVWGNMRMKDWMERNAELIDILYLRREDDAHIKIYFYDPVAKIHANSYLEKKFSSKDLQASFIR